MASRVPRVDQRNAETDVDLSCEGIEVVPLQQLSLHRRITRLDLSNNRIRILTDDFAPLLPHVVDIDLSKNQLSELPDNFGMIINLQKLDLYGNQIERLPLSMAKMRKLQWLDLKENPLVPALQQICGDCSDSRSCQRCAKSVVIFLGQVESALSKDNERITRVNEWMANEDQTLNNIEGPDVSQASQISASASNSRASLLKKRGKKSRKAKTTAAESQANNAEEDEIDDDDDEIARTAAFYDDAPETSVRTALYGDSNVPRDGLRFLFWIMFRNLFGFATFFFGFCLLLGMVFSPEGIHSILGDQRSTVLDVIHYCHRLGSSVVPPNLFPLATDPVDQSVFGKFAVTLMKMIISVYNAIYSIFPWK